MNGPAQHPPTRAPSSPPTPSPDAAPKPEHGPRRADPRDAPVSHHEPPPRKPANGQPAVDPLSEHIYNRTHPHDLKQHARTHSEIPAASPAAAVTHERAESLHDPHPQKERRKGVKLLSRFMPAKKKDLLDEPEPVPEDLEDRPEGFDAHAFYQSVEHVGYNPKYPQPPGYVKVRARYKKVREFHRIFLAQELNDEPRLRRISSQPTDGPRKLRKERTLTAEDEAIWAMSFSRDGKYVATAGQDKCIRIWSVLNSPEERKRHEKDEEANGFQDEEAVHLSAPVFRAKPRRVYEGHDGPILDLSWSKNNFLLSSSMDKTVRLWHVSRPECLCAFKHTDIVTSIRFHPMDDRFFLAGSLDSKLRLWSIPDKSVAFWNHLPDLITSVGFTPDGKTAIAGCLSGLVHFYDTEGLKYQTQIQVKSAHGKNAKGSKITGIETAHIPENGPVKLLITSNDSRIRLYNFRDKSLEMKFKGLENFSSQIHARFSDDGRQVICGSEDNKVYIWNTNAVDVERKNKWPLEVFDAHSATTTCAVLAPIRTRQFLSHSEDPVYDLCNPPPVLLVSSSEAKLPSFSSKDSANDSDTASIQPPPSISNSSVKGLSSPRPAESPSYLSRTSHASCGGAIIVTADATGCVKVFRQDCAFEKRRSAIEWEARTCSGSALTRRLGSTTSSLIRRASQATQHSGTSMSRADSTTSLHRRAAAAAAANGVVPGIVHAHTFSASISSSTHSLERGKHPSTGSFRAALNQRHERSVSPRNTKFAPRNLFTTSSSKHASPIVTPIDTCSTPNLLLSDTAGPGPALSPSPDTFSPVDSKFTASTTLTATTSALTATSTAPSTPSSAHSSAPSSIRPGLRGARQQSSNADYSAAAALARQNSDRYWQRDAWRDEIVGQLAGHHLHNHRFLDVAGPRKGGSGSESGRSSMHSADLERRISGVSALTDNST